MIIVDCFETAYLEELDDALGEDGGDARDKERVLHVLAGNVQRHVLGVDHTLHKAEVVGQQALRLGLNQHLAAVQRGTCDENKEKNK